MSGGAGAKGHRSHSHDDDRRTLKHQSPWTMVFAK
jgi:hypothetical protein